MDKHWYVVSTHSKFEEFVKDELRSRSRAYGLEEKFGEVLIPTEKVVEIRGGRKVISTKQVYPGYVLVHMELTPATWQLVKKMDKVMGFVPPHTRTPPPMPEEEIERIRAEMDEGQAPKMRQEYRLGDSVRIIDGSFKGFQGQVDEVDRDRSTLKVMVTIFGRSTPVELEFIQVEKM